MAHAGRENHAETESYSLTKATYNGDLQERCDEISSDPSSWANSEVVELIEHMLLLSDCEGSTLLNVVTYHDGGIDYLLIERWTQLRDDNGLTIDCEGVLYRLELHEFELMDCQGTWMANIKDLISR